VPVGTVLTVISNLFGNSVFAQDQWLQIGFL
jgi:hypothetical protein